MKILMVEDERMTRIALTGTLRKEGHEVLPCPDGHTAIAALDNNGFDVVLTDLNIPGPDGIEILRYAVQKDPKIKVIIMTAYASTETAVEALRIGAYDYLTKPFKTDEILVTIQRAFEKRALVRENVTLREELRGRFRLDRMVGRSPAMEQLFALIRQVAATRSSVLIFGESGTGKELVARAIHSLSERAEKTFVPVNCAAIPDTLMESELLPEGAHHTVLGTTCLGR